MLASVILPSRRRPEKLRAALQSVIDTAVSPENVELLVRLDSDDRDTLFLLEEIAAVHEEIHFIVGPRYEGYASAGKFWNELARQARGDWCLTFNDDAIMLDPGWDEALLAYDPRLKENLILHPRDNYNNTSFPILSSHVYEIFGHVTRFCGIDTWSLCWTGAAEIDIKKVHAIRIEHQRPNIRTFEKLSDAAWEETALAQPAVGEDWLVNKLKYIDLAVEDALVLQEALK